MHFACFHTAFEDAGGAEILAAAQARFLKSQGIWVEVVTFGYEASKWQTFLESIPVHLIAKRHWADLFGPWSRVEKIRNRGHRAAKALASFDVVLAHNFPTSAMLGEAKIPAKKMWYCHEPPRGIHPREANPTLTLRLSTHGNAGPEKATREFSKALDKHDRQEGLRSSTTSRQSYDLNQCRHIDTIIANSEFTRDHTKRIYQRSDVEVVYPIVRFPESTPNRSGLNRSIRRILTHSRLGSMKNIDTVILGFSEFASRSPVPCELHVVGEGPVREQLQALAMETCRVGEVHFHGYLPDHELRGVYELCDVFALLALDEPFGMVYPEAAAWGLLLVGPDHGGPMEILDGSRLGWSIDAFSPEALCEALGQIWSLDDAEVDQRREAADRACRDRFGLAAVGPQLMALIHRE